MVTTTQSGSKFRMIVGSGYCRDGQKNGCVLQYSATDVQGPWCYDGIVAEGDWQHGRVWECPALVQVRPQCLALMFSQTVCACTLWLVALRCNNQWALAMPARHTIVQQCCCWSSTVSGICMRLPHQASAVEYGCCGAPADIAALPHGWDVHLPVHSDDPRRCRW